MDVQHYDVFAPTAPQHQHKIKVVYFKSPFENSNTELFNQLSKLKSKHNSNGLTIVGLDTESFNGQVQLIQLCVGYLCILIHRRSGLFSSLALKNFFRNEKNEGKIIIFEYF